MRTGSGEALRHAGAFTAGSLSAYLELTKPRITMMVVITAAAGYYLASTGAVDLRLLFHALFGTALTAGGSAALNQYLERLQDGRMPRTKDRPVPSGRVKPGAALLFGMVLVISGVIYLTVVVNPLAAALAALTAVLYLGFYTPLKTRTSMCTTVGAAPGAIPPLIGWAAAGGALDAQAWTLFAILFLWQFPHFLAISWAYQTDYQSGGFNMLPRVDPGGSKTVRRIFLLTSALVLVSLLPYRLGLAGPLYLGCAAILGALLLYYVIRLVLDRSRGAARQLSFATVAYLPLLLIWMVVDKP
jgi:heme o synthase